jgi:hypothetical protein
MVDNYFQIDGWCGSEITRLYDQMVIEAKDDSVFVEIGCYKGKSTCYLIDKIKESNKKIKLYVIDNFSTLGDVKDEFLSNIGEERAKSIQLIVQDSVSSSNLFDDNSVDFVFIDTDHYKELLKSEISAWKNKVKTNGIIGGHDYHMYDLKDAFDELGVSHYNVLLSELHYYDGGKYRKTAWYFKNTDI